MARAAQIEQVAVQSIALNLTSVLAPYRKHGRLSLRVERLPQNARLSRGTRNNDATWSLASDELEDLCVLTPEAFKKDINLGVRIISLINGNTLTTLELPIRPGDEAAVAKAPAMPSPAEIAELNVLRKELAAAKDALSARDSELAERLAAAATDTSNQFEQTLAKAEAAWTDAENGRLASVQQQWQEKFAEALTEIDGAKVEAHEAQVRDLEEKIAVLQASLDQGSVALTEAKAADAAAREHGHSATQDALKKLAELQTKLADREADLLRAVASSDATKRDAEAALAKAEQAWRDGEAQRLAAAEAHWREVSDKALSDARANSETLLTKGGASERDLLNRVAELQAAITERDEALARTNAANEQARAHAAHETEVQLAKAADTWKAAEAARLAKVEADWRAKLDDAAKAVVADAPIMPVPTANEAELQALRDKTNSLQAKLTLRDAAAARAAKLSDEERRRWQKEAQDVIVKAARERKSDENARFAAAQADWTKQSVRELALASARAEAAEAALAQLRIRASEEAPLCPCDHKPPPSLHSPLFYPDAEESLRIGIPAMVAIALELLPRQSAKSSKSSAKE